MLHVTELKKYYEHMKSIVTSEYSIHFNSKCYTELNAYLRKSNFSKIVVIVDTNTHNYCYPYFIEKVETNLEIEIIEIEAGEIHKTIDTCVGVWNALSELNVDKKSLIINLGGGMVTDLGGFVASTYRRGLKYINVPTSLLAMVDASVGGKTGVDLNTLKNQIGVINTAQMILVDTHLLSSLPQNEIRSGFAEMLKHGLIQSESYWNSLKDLSMSTHQDFDDLIYESILIKQDIVDLDPFENNLPQRLPNTNFLQTPIDYLKGVGPNRADLLRKELGLHTYQDLINLFPNSYIDRTQYYKINQLQRNSSHVTILKAWY